MSVRILSGSVAADLRSAVAELIKPVPGGGGPMTFAGFLANTVVAPEIWTAV